MFPIATFQSLDNGVIVAEEEEAIELETTELELLASEELPTVELEEAAEVGVEETIDELELSTKEEVVAG
jgi:hypothetical protein